MPDVILGRKEDGTLDEVRLDDDGALKTSAEVTAPDGSELAKEDGGNLETIASATFEGEAPLEPQRKVAAYVTGGEITTLPGQTFASASAAAANPGGLPGAFVAGALDQGAAHPTERWGVSDQTAQDIQRDIDTAVRTVEDAVDELEAGQATGNASLSAIESDADASRIAEQSVDAKTLAPVGTTFSPTRFTATNSATQFASLATPRGFAIENLDTANDLFVGPTSGVTTSNGWRISPGRSRFFPLDNADRLYHISASTTAAQIGAVS